MKRGPREQERPVPEMPDEGFEPRSVVRSERRAVPEPIPSTWLGRHWVSVVGVSIGLLVSLWRFGGAHVNRSPSRVAFPMAEFHWHGPVTVGHRVEVRGVSGAIRAVAAAGNEVEVTALKRARGMNPAEIPVAVIQRDGDVTFCAAAPGAPGECAEGGNAGRAGGVSIEYTVQVPTGVLFTARTVNGGITVDGLTAAAELETVNGPIEVSTTGTARATTVNGSIRAAVGSTGEDLTFETVNGSISVAVPENASVDVRAETMSGGISTEFPLNIETARPGPQKTATGRIGSGGHQLKMETVNGSIALRKATQGGPLPPPPPPRATRPLPGSERQ
ncbi:MAG: DUF4097 family beta strand repeat protein [Gemmatimonadetes bacterium]|nr:DUF4097 family beta strand repeat protein [Gemmatimonadota bacterium]